MKSTRNVLALALLLPSMAMAEPYVFGGGGISRLSTASGSDSDFSFTLGAGYRFGRIGAEAAYTDLGRVKSANSTGTVTTTQSVSAAGLGLAAIMDWPLTGSVAIVGRLGTQQLRMKVKTSVTDSAGPGTSTTSVDSTDRWRPAIGVGLQWRGEKMRARLLIERVDGEQPVDRTRILSLTGVLPF